MMPKITAEFDITVQVIPKDSVNAHIYAAIYKDTIAEGTLYRFPVQASSIEEVETIVKERFKHLEDCNTVKILGTVKASEDWQMVNKTYQFQGEKNATTEPRRPK